MVNDFIVKKPEEEGLPSSAVKEFIDYIHEWKINLHSFMVVRHGNILAEGYYKPFHQDFPHRLYSSSKTYVAMAIGVLIGEGKLRLEDRLVEFFPEWIDREQHKWMQDCTVEDALKMSVPVPVDTYFQTVSERWAWTFFNVSYAAKPAGTVFHYNTSGTFILDVLIEKLTGKTFLEVLRPVFDKIGVSKEIWCVKSPDGYAWGGSGVVCTLRDYAKFAELLLRKGEYNGEQLLPRDYVERATSKQIDNLYENEFSIWRKTGYGYQVWITQDGYAMYGMGSQYAFCFPEKDFLFVCQGDTQCAADRSGDLVYGGVKHLLYNRLQDEPLPKDEEGYQTMRQALDDLTLFTDFGAKYSAFEKQLDGATYRLEENSMGWKWIRFTFTGDEGVLTYENARGEKQIKFGLNAYTVGTFPETHYYDTQVGKPANRELDCMAAASWTEEKKLLLRVFITDTNFGNCYMTFGFKGDEVGVMLCKRAEMFMDDYQGMAGGYLVKGENEK